MLAPDSETEDVIPVTSNLSKVHSLKAAIFHTMAFKHSLEINKNKVTQKSLIAFLKVLYNITKIKKKKITFEQYSRLHLDDPKLLSVKRCQMSLLFLIHPSPQRTNIFELLYKKLFRLSKTCFRILATPKN